MRQTSIQPRLDTSNPLQSSVRCPNIQLTENTFILAIDWSHFSSFTTLIKPSFELKPFEERSDATLRSRQLFKYSKISANFQQLCECERHLCSMWYV